MVTLVCATWGCHESMIETPHVMRGEAGRAAFAQTPPAQRTPEMKVMYVTDRAAETPDGPNPNYGYKRSPILEYGVATCTFGANVTWDELVADSTTDKRAHEYVPKVTNVEWTGSMLPLISRGQVLEGRVVHDHKARQEIRAEQVALNQTVDRWLDHSERKEAVIFIHGYNNTFDDAVLRLAQAWHFAGRAGVPIVFSWPAGSPGLLGGYQHDRESGEYANLHLKLLLVTLASNPKIHKIHIIAHSRGTDVATTAVRELHAEIRAGMGKSLVCDTLGIQRAAERGADAPPDPRLPWMALKLETLVLAAPDLDLEVFSQRYLGENVLNCAKRTVIYFSSADQALGLSDWLFNSRSRVGNFSRSDLSPQAIHMAEQLTELELVNCTVSGGSSHSYVMQHPAALSDLILLLRDGRKPGADHGRPLKEPHKAFWELDNDYMRPPSNP